uniref:Uncharacterized protein n=1 Tax=Fibrocapsa japonica TaxID=94617 RepID=A0A7S2V1M3_9STRA|mmetsp:Transcript_21818/g.31662  ORF Transcript_21818/g.31662 Transcript_21818/m.31662 type:complete len:242 (+) Transcript_21818:195-920(+)|eukprot:CAMPEP_0113933736 /NCGR_PEP_ID=MMETSP1339-20121228/1049_1 /TAXON_ID=94617 /ORGANISM="Fibrocapsa japonica" /LENGTH=241 /DNA_ID=CAMNT_0000935185 /DNA_START=127 /DNA_END=852 /DNA_ORIENTATION=+ /assembly_acc=CAM_ASM_000762
MAQPQVMMVQVTEAPQEDWKSGLFGCCSSPKNLIFACCLPWCAVADARTKFDGSNCCFNVMCVGIVAGRNIIREGYKIKGGCIGDLIATLFCPVCVMTQMMNEVESRGKVTAQYGSNRPATEVPWKHSIFDICFNSSNFIYGCCCPSCAIAQARTDFDGSDCCFNFLCFTPCLARSVIREGYNIEGSCIMDILCPWLCVECVACQLMNEVSDRGKVTKQYVSVTAAPQVPSTVPQAQSVVR